jgi:hypothetical protein
MKPVDSFPALAVTGSLILAPAVLLGSAIASPPLRGTQAGQLAVIAHEPSRWYLFSLLSTLGSMLLIPAFVGIMNLVKQQNPWLGYLGCALAGFGALVAIGDSMIQMVMWQMGLAPSSDRAEMVALANRVDQAFGLSILFMLGGLGLTLGSLLFAAALWRSRCVPRWAAAALPLATVTNIAGFGANSASIVILSCVILLASFGAAAATVFGAVRVQDVATHRLGGTGEHAGPA